jgi:hypothetical protein
MSTFEKVRKVVLVLVVGGALTLSFSCHGHPNDEQIRVMEETRSAALSAEQKLEETKKQCQDLENELAQKQQRAQKAKDQKAAVEQRVQGWQGN